jgi:hypothetical protein
MEASTPTEPIAQDTPTTVMDMVMDTEPVVENTTMKIRKAGDLNLKQVSFNGSNRQTKQVSKFHDSV